MEHATIDTYLEYKEGSMSGFEILSDITSYPDLFTAPEKLDISDLSSRQKKYAEGMTDVPDYTFGANYVKVTYDKVKKLEGKTDIEFRLLFGKTGQYGAWGWTGSIFANVKGGEVGGKREMEITSYPQSDITPTIVSDT